MCYIWRWNWKWITLKNKFYKKDKSANAMNKKVNKNLMITKIP